MEKYDFEAFINSQSVNFDRTQNFVEHKTTVVQYLLYITEDLRHRAVVHDDSKLDQFEKDMYDALSKEYKHHKSKSNISEKSKMIIKRGLEHHYCLNNHHPEHFKNGINDMTLIDIIEMLCDWMTYADRCHKDINEIIDYYQHKYNFSNEFKTLINNTIKDIYDKSQIHKNI